MVSPAAPADQSTASAGRGQPPAPDAPWSRPASELVASLDSDVEAGLQPREASLRLERAGPNRLREHARRGLLDILLAQFRSVVVGLLAAAALLSFAFGADLEAVSILVVLLLNTGIGFFTELRAVQSVEALRELGTVETTVRRGGRVLRVPAEELVPGDLVLVEGGDVVTADLRLVEASRLQASEAALTGESAPVEKDTEPCPPDAPLAERRGMLYKGTSVTRGSGLGVVVATGMETELGRISSLVEEAEEEVTPLERRLNRLGRRLVWVTLALAAAVAVSGVLVGKDVYLIVETAIALAVAAIPEGLPIVATLALARGMWRMAERNALVERLSAVETLGSTSVILTDKTGTLTESRMTVVRAELPAGPVELGGDGSPDGGASTLPAESDRGDGAAASGTGGAGGREEAQLRAALLVGALCNNATLPRRQGDDGRAAEDESARDAPAGDRRGAAVGDPTEVALLMAAEERGMTRERLVEALPEVREEAFDPEVKMMATVHELRDPAAAPGLEELDDGGEHLVAVKGAPDAVLEACSRTLPGPPEEGGGEDAGAQASGDSAIAPLDGAARRRWLESNQRLGEEGLRVLAVAARRVDDPDAPAYEDLVFLGLLGLADPPRLDVASAVAACRRAGVRVVMVTGDQPATARRVAAAVGIGGDEGEEDGEVVTGGELRPASELSEEERQRLLRSTVFARTSPEQKMLLLGLHQDAGSVVAMIGDGVNDAPALKKADIGVAMGQRGTQVAREASDMILQDDHFSTIAAAVEHGRVIFNNIRKFVVYLLSCNVSEIVAVSLATVANAPLPILPLQILFLNLVTDVFPALALGVSRGSPSVMERPPRPRDEPVLARRHWRSVGGFGLTISVVVLGALAVALGPLGFETERAVTVSFLTLAFAQLWHVFNMAPPDAGLVLNEVSRSGLVWGAVGLCVALLLAAVYLPGPARVLDVTDPGARGWALVAGASVVPLLVGRSASLLLRRQRGRRGPRAAA